MALFLAIIGWLVASSLVRPSARMFAPTPPGISAGDGAEPDTLTVDAADESAWRYVDLDRGRILSPPDTAGWDLALRRFHIVPADAAADLGPVAFDTVARVSAGGFVPTRRGHDTTNAALARWYDYRMMAHVLEPKPRLYAVRTPEGRIAKVQLLGYYCPRMRAGCVTLRWAFVPAGE